MWCEGEVVCGVKERGVWCEGEVVCGVSGELCCELLRL